MEWQSQFVLDEMRQVSKPNQKLVTCLLNYSYKVYVGLFTNKGESGDRHKLKSLLYWLEHPRLACDKMSP